MAWNCSGADERVRRTGDSLLGLLGCTNWFGRCSFEFGLWVIQVREIIRSGDLDCHCDSVSGTYVIVVFVNLNLQVEELVN